MTDKIRITKIETGFSESFDLANRTFDTVADFDIAVVMATAHQLASDLSYYKTDVTIEWEDGTVHHFTLDANRAYNLSKHYQDQYRFYTRKQPDWYQGSVTDWMREVRECKVFFETYQI